MSGFTESLEIRNERKAYLDEKVEAAKVVVTAHRSVTTRDDLAINFCRDRDMLANGKTQNI